MIARRTPSFLVRRALACYARAGHRRAGNPEGARENIMNIFIPDVAIAERIGRTVVGYLSLLVASRLAVSARLAI